MDLVLSKEAHELKLLTPLQKYHVLDSLHGYYEVKNLSEFGVSAEDRGAMSLIALIEKYPRFNHKFTVSIITALESFDIEQLQDSEQDYKKKYTNDDGLKLIQSQIKRKQGK